MDTIIDSDSVDMGSIPVRDTNFTININLIWRENCV